MKARLTLKPTHRKAKKFYRKYGDRLVYVRYRYDVVRQKRFTTVEIIVDEADWTPPRVPLPEEIVGVRVEKEERDVQLRIKQVGGKWNWRKRVTLTEVVDICLFPRFVMYKEADEELGTEVYHHWNWKSGRIDSLAEDDGIIPPTGVELKKVLETLNGPIPEDGVDAQILRW